MSEMFRLTPAAPVRQLRPHQVRHRVGQAAVISGCIVVILSSSTLFIRPLTHLIISSSMSEYVPRGDTGERSCCGQFRTTCRTTAEFLNYELWHPPPQTRNPMDKYEIYARLYQVWSTHLMRSDRWTHLSSDKCILVENRENVKFRLVSFSWHSSLPAAPQFLFPRHAPDLATNVQVPCQQRWNELVSGQKRGSFEFFQLLLAWALSFLGRTSWAGARGSLEQSGRIKWTRV